MVALFYTLSFGFAAGSDRTLQAFLERYAEMADCEELSYAAFHEWFEPTFVALLREILDDASRRRGSPAVAVHWLSNAILIRSSCI